MHKVEYIKREIFPSVASHLQAPEITLITGSRQVGKTVLLTQLREHLVTQQRIQESQVVWHNLDFMQDQEAFQDQTAFIRWLKDRSRQARLYVLVDEAQKVPDAARFFKGVYDAQLNVKLILTGSASLEAKARLKETLAGRKRIFALSPFTFAEFLQSKDAALAEALRQEATPNPIDVGALCRWYEEYLRFGGYPRVVLAESAEEKVALLKEIYTSYVETDAVGFWGIRHPPAFHRLLKLLAAQIGQLVNVQELATTLGIDRHTVEHYLTVLEATFVMRRLSPYFRNPRQEIIKAGKAYFLDAGIRNIALEAMAPIPHRVDRGALLESGVFVELSHLTASQSGQVHFWRTKQKAEVDFVLERGMAVTPIEVKSALTPGSVPRGLRSFIQTFKPAAALLVSLTVPDPGPLTIGKTRVSFLYPFFLRKAMGG
jgi:predicted AAA+ superfamily ATPase